MHIFCDFTVKRFLEGKNFNLVKENERKLAKNIFVQSDKKQVKKSQKKLYIYTTFIV